MDDEPAAELYALTQEFLATKGYPQYEVSNFAHPGYESIHNLAYWRGQNYLGIATPPTDASKQPIKFMPRPTIGNWKN